MAAAIRPEEGRRIAAVENEASSSGSRSYEVFLSFYGKDVRTSFADHLYNALIDGGIQTFRDSEELHKGNKIETELLDAIQGSKISIPIFSKNYASSKWCLRELAQISECGRTMNQTVLPVFYKVEPRDVRNQTGEYAKAFEEHQINMDSDVTTVENWRKALKEVGGFNGWHSLEDTYEGDLIKEVLREVRKTLSKRPFSTETNTLVGIESHIREMLMLLDIESSDRKIVGIHGLGGIGKTTIAKAVYSQVFNHFEGCSFISDVRETAQQPDGLVCLQKKLIFDILKQENENITSVDGGTGVISERLPRKKVLIVLDDVDQDIQVKSLVGDRRWFGIGSKIIITSRDKHILDVQDPDEVYKPSVMDSNASLQLFSHHAFKRDQPLDDYLDLSKAIVKTTGGLPLALQVTGSSLYLKKKPVWKDMLRELQNVPHDDVIKRLKISYHALKDAEKQMFLDIACFFIGMHRDIVCYIWDGCGLFPESGLDALCVRSMVTINGKGVLGMHDLLRDLGREIVRQENNDEPGKRTRIWSQEDVLEILMTQAGSSSVKGLSIDFRSILTGEGLMSEGFTAMTRLRLLRIDYAQFSWDFIHSFSELRWLSWKGCSDQCGKLNFHPWKLVVLDLSHSKITHNWMGWKYIKMAKDLRVLDLTSCWQLSRVPDVSANRLLAVLLLNDCKYLREIDPSIFCLTNLVMLNMDGCKRVEELPSDIGKLSSLQKLNLYRCESLKKLPEKFGQMISLTELELGRCKSLTDLPTEIYQLTSLQKFNLQGCESLKKLPEKFGQMISLMELDLGFCESLVDLPTGICQLTSLQKLKLNGCKSLKKLPENFGQMISLMELDLGSCQSLVDLPTGICHLTLLQKLNLSWCKELKKLPEKFGQMISLMELDLEWCKSLVDLPTEICQLSSLQKLILARCEKLKKLPEKLDHMVSLTEIDLECCTSLVDLPSEICKLTSLQKLLLKGCYNLKKLPEKWEHMISLTELTLGSDETVMDLAGEISQLNSIRKFGLSNCSNIVDLQLTSLSSLSLESCRHLINLGFGSSYSGLTKLRIWFCPSLRYISALPLSLVTFCIWNCGSLAKLSSTTCLRNLRELRLMGCRSLEEIEIEGVDERLDSLEELNIQSCNALKNLPRLEGSKNLTSILLVGNQSISIVEGKGWDSLEKLQIWHFQSLRKILNLQDSKKLLELEIRDCPELSEIKGFEECKSLNKLGIEGARSFETLPDISTLSKLSCLRISDCCYSIKILPDLSNCIQLRELYIGNRLSKSESVNYWESLIQIPGLDRLVSLQTLGITDCVAIQSLPDLSNLNNLTHLHIMRCKNLMEIHGIDRLLILEELNICGCESSERLLDLSNLRNLRILTIQGCKNLTQIPGVGTGEILVELNISGCESLERLSDLSDLRNLKVLKIQGCKNLTQIPGVSLLQILERLKISGCASLERLPDLSNLRNLKYLLIEGCENLTQIPGVSMLEILNELNVSGCESLERLPELPKNLRNLKIEGLMNLTEVHGVDRLEFLRYFNIIGLESLERLPDLSNCKSLSGIRIKGFKILSEIQGVDTFKGLECLDISGCESLERLPDLSDLKSLETLDAKDCKKLNEIRAGNNALKSLKSLDVRGCISLEKVPNLTKSDLSKLNGVSYWELTDAGLVQLLADGGCTKLQLASSDLPKWWHFFVHDKHFQDH